MFFFIALAAAGVLLGAAAHTTLPQFLVAGAVIGAWLLAFGLREGAAWLRHR
ncbi:hypothetical protein [Kitasatospora kifunensis]|uniref:Uncharacterized protein n=1 Tax=Kitasatospora kifunensis TaxID=58351 RepID=A0A7W7R840_KITKI|nr:hypothetical protein [Kitasatospora kifunensis]MBB4927126.1 hypothetical protein [Kitasatospora kifunensis]